jgi:hypothetical protein
MAAKAIGNHQVVANHGHDLKVAVDGKVKGKRRDEFGTGSFFRPVLSW